MKRINNRERRKQKTTAAACLTLGTVWAVGLTARPVFAQDTPPAPVPVAPAPVTPAVPGTADENESPVIGLPATPEEAPEADIFVRPGTPDTPDAAPFQLPKGEIMPPRPAAPVPVLRDLPYIGNLYQFGGQSTATADKTRRILALREMLKLGLTADDIAKALPLLRRLRDAQSQPPADPAKALDDEYQALLKARPGDPLPPSSAMKMQNAAQFVQDEQRTVWADLTKQIGAKKTEGLRSLVGQSAAFSNFNRMFFYNGAAPTLQYQNDIGVSSYRLNVTRPNAKPPRAERRTAPRNQSDTTFVPVPEPVAPVAPGAPQALTPAMPAAPGLPAPDNSRTRPGTVAPAAATPEPSYKIYRSPDYTAADPTYYALQSVTVPNLNAVNAKAQNHFQVQNPIFGASRLNAPVFITSAAGRLTLAELIDLLEQKLAAMQAGRGS